MQYPENSHNEDHEHPGDLNNSFLHSYLVCNGCRLHVVEYKEGQQASVDRPLMLFLHGFPEFWYSWKPLLCHFSQQGYRAVAPDLRGYNESEKPTSISAYRLEVLCSDVERLIVQLGYSSCVCVGHDWGGAIAWSVAYTYPYRVDQLITINAPHPIRFREEILKFPPNWTQLVRSWYIFFFQLPWIPELLLEYHDFKGLIQAIRNSLSDPQLMSREDMQAYRQALRQPLALKSAINYYRALGRYVLKGTGLFRGLFSSRLETPTLVIWGEDDTALGKELTFGLERLVNDIQIKYIPHCSHWVPIEKPELVIELISRFLHL